MSHNFVTRITHFCSCGVVHSEKEYDETIWATVGKLEDEALFAQLNQAHHEENHIPGDVLEAADDWLIEGAYND